MKIIVDAMGGDNAPYEIVAGALAAQRDTGADILLVGKTEEILRSFEAMGISDLPRGIEIHNAEGSIDMEDDPVSAIRTKRDSSMVVALNLLHDGAGDALVSAGSTGALLTGATVIVKRVRGIRRAALAPFVPSKSGGFLMIDCGANAECTPEYLLQFAYMGAYYVENTLGVKNPRVALLNNGTEPHKGTALQIETHALLSAPECQLNFVGNLEGSGALNGGCDVLVCDGFSGNIMLKTIEGAAKFIMSELKPVFKKNILTYFAAALVRGGLNNLKQTLNPDRVGGTAMLGIAKPVIKAHGSSGAAAITAAIGQAIRAAETNIAEKLHENVGAMKI